VTAKKTARLCTRTIRYLEQDLYREARIKALDEEITIGEWINLAMKERLTRIKTAKDSS